MNDNQKIVYYGHQAWQVFVRACKVMGRITKFVWRLTRFALHLLLWWCR